MRISTPPLFPVVLFLLTFINASISAQVTLQYRHQTGDKWHITSRINEEVLFDGKIYRRVEILNKISVEVLKSNGNDGLLHNHYQIAERQVGEDFYTWSEEYKAIYGRDTRGRISGLKESPPIPPVRNVPVYPEAAVEISDVWEAPGQELFDLQHTYGIQEIIVIDFTAFYRYEGPETIDGRDTEKVLIEYSYDWTPDLSLLRRLRKYEIFPVKITGDFTQFVYWDQAAGKNYAEEGRFSYTYSMNDGHTYTFRGTTQGHAVYADPMDKEDLVEEIKKLDDVDAFVTDEGVSLTLDNIHFVPDSAEMLPGEEAKLALIADILRKIPDRDILITGHTASVGPYSDGLELSEKRAGTVAKYFIETGTRRSTQIITRGMGDNQPLAYNDTEEGRKKNRRVEISILEN